MTITDADREAAVRLGFRGGSKFATETLAHHREQAVHEAVAGIVRWLRGDAPNDYNDPQYDIGINLADAIERGDWK